MTGKTIGITVIVLVIIGGAWYFLSGSSSMPPAAATTPPGAATTTASSPSGAVMVSYTNQGFSPASVSVAQGGTVMWMNNSSESLWVASDPHPEHNGYDGTTRQQHCAAGYAGPTPFDECTMIPPGGSWSFVFNQVGTWGYHNHADASMRGTVVVTAPAASSTASAAAGVNVNVQ